MIARLTTRELQLRHDLIELRGPEHAGQAGLRRRQMLAAKLRHVEAHLFRLRQGNLWNQ